MGLGPFSPSRRACEARFGAFGKMECLLSIAPDANSWWLALWSKGEEVRSENELVAKLESGDVAVCGRPDAEVQRPVNTTGASGRPDFCPVKG